MSAKLCVLGKELLIFCGSKIVRKSVAAETLQVYDCTSIEFPPVPKRAVEAEEENKADKDASSAANLKMSAKLCVLGKELLIFCGSKIVRKSVAAETLQVYDCTSIEFPPVPKRAVEAEEENKADKDASSAANLKVFCSAVNVENNLIGVGLSNKTVAIFDAGLVLQRVFHIPKASTSLCFDKNSSHIIVGDRAGHIIRYGVKAPSQPVRHKDITGELCEYEGEPLTGAVSMILDVSLTNDGRFLLGADRDEKIRVSRYPQSYVVHSYCLGHSAYVATLAQYEQRIFSSGGDSTVFEWNIETGRPIAMSEKFDEKPIRKLVAHFQDELSLYAVLEGQQRLLVLSVTGKAITKKSELRLTKPLIDLVSLGDKGLVGVSSDGLVVIDASAQTTVNLPIPELSTELEAVKDPIGNYFKNVTHNNVEEYEKRKASKMEIEKAKKEKHLERKRKAMEMSAAGDTVEAE